MDKKVFLALSGSLAAVAGLSLWAYVKRNNTSRQA